MAFFIQYNDVFLCDRELWTDIYINVNFTNWYPLYIASHLWRMCQNQTLARVGRYSRILQYVRQISVCLSSCFFLTLHFCDICVFQIVFSWISRGNVCSRKTHAANQLCRLHTVVCRILCPLWWKTDCFRCKSMLFFIIKHASLCREVTHFMP